MDPDYWGDPAWKFLNSIVLTYPDVPTDEDKENYKKFFMTLNNVLPCNVCRINYQKHINNKPLTNKILEDKRTFIGWLIDIHNDVNISNGKNVLGKEQALKIMIDDYNNFVDYKYYKKNGYLYQICLCIIVFIIIIVASYVVYGTYKYRYKI